MRKLLSLTRLNLANSFIERADMLLYTISNCIAPLVILFVWLSFTPPGQSSVYAHSELIWYFTLVILVRTLASAWGGQFLANRIRRGAISPFLTQPAPYIYHYISNNLAEKLVKIIILIPLLLAVVVLLRAGLPHINLASLGLSILSTLLAAALFFILDVIMGLLSFWLDETSAIGEAFGLLYVLFSGSLIPLVALPPITKTLSYLLPFRYTVSFPIEIFLNQVSGSQLYFGLLLQLLWTIATGLLCLHLWKQGLKIYSASGA